MRTEFYNGMLYQIEFCPEESNFDYTAHKVWYIKTDEKSYPVAHKAIQSIMNDSSWTYGEYKQKNKENPNMFNGLHSYHKFSYEEEKDKFRYELVIPYDD